ncbi:vesicle-associated membrane protein 714-like isoform X3 [Canis lupus familiaris]|uniref:vesicle-associated membrane protein 714-like isoform X3 n=1 Tax=Canis lupus familiaris TaxID=9615 RepID=UPI0015F1A417|nr:vesicle-associated membrane protein 714-like isoform X3 [Canis lupus familiaris]XP_038438238.1 vesicle-associated membrane protein 714-like isoform X3 [Canis lupus familiaris]
MTITYSCVANGRAVLAELALTGGSYQEAAATVLRLVLLRAEQKTIIQMGSFVYHTLFIDGITYLCATDNALDTITPSAFLTNMKYNKNQDGSSISTLKSQVTDVKNIMSQNIDEILESEKRLNIYTDRTSYLQTTAKESQKPRKILRRIWWKHFKKIIIITVGRASLVCFSPRSFSSKEADPMTKPKCRGWKLDYSGFVICSFLRYT